MAFLQKHQMKLFLKKKNLKSNWHIIAVVFRNSPPNNTELLFPVIEEQSVKIQSTED